MSKESKRFDKMSEEELEQQMAHRKCGAKDFVKFILDVPNYCFKAGKIYKMHIKDCEKWVRLKKAVWDWEENTYDDDENEKVAIEIKYPWDNAVNRYLDNLGIEEAGYWNEKNAKWVRESKGEEFADDDYADFDENEVSDKEYENEKVEIIRPEIVKNLTKTEKKKVTRVFKCPICNKDCKYPKGLQKHYEEYPSHRPIKQEKFKNKIKNTKLNTEENADLVLKSE